MSQSSYTVHRVVARSANPQRGNSEEFIGQLEQEEATETPDLEAPADRYPGTVNPVAAIRRPMGTSPRNAHGPGGSRSQRRPPVPGVRTPSPAFRSSQGSMTPVLAGTAPHPGFPALEYPIPARYSPARRGIDLAMSMVSILRTRATHAIREVPTYPVLRSH